MPARASRPSTPAWRRRWRPSRARRRRSSSRSTPPRPSGPPPPTSASVRDPASRALAARPATSSPTRGAPPTTCWPGPSARSPTCAGSSPGSATWAEAARRRAARHSTISSAGRRGCEARRPSRRPRRGRWCAGRGPRRSSATGRTVRPLANARQHRAHRRDQRSHRARHARDGGRAPGRPGR